jgi:hypothetical protein
MPRSLTALQAQYYCYRDDVEFPPQLMHLKLELQYGVLLSLEYQDFLAILPPSLETLEIKFDNKQELPFSITALPANLTSLRIENCVPLDFNDILLSLPLTELYLEESNIEDLMKLPSSLRTFETKLMRQKEDPMNEDTIPTLIGALPRQLTSLSILTLDDDMYRRTFVDGQKLKFPQELSIIRCPWLGMIDLERVQSLPSATITCLVTCMMWDNIMDKVSKWPQLKELHVLLSSSSTSATNRFFNHLSQHSPLLNCLSIRASRSFGLEPELHPVFHRFSRHLTSLTLSDCSYVDDTFLRDLIPSSIRQLKILEKSSITDFGIQSLSHCINLTELDASSCDKITSGCFKHLPRHLTTLIASSTPNIFDYDIADLPRSLTEINLESATELTDACIPFLPTTTKCFLVSDNRNISSAILGLLPFPAAACTIIAAKIKLRDGVLRA